jgi:outer membrane protein assembly factor BamB
MKWRYNAGGRVFSSPAIADGRVFFGVPGSEFLVLDTQEGKPQMGSGTEGPINSSPAIVNGVVYFGCDDSWFYAME